MAQGGTEWAEWYPAIRDELIRRQTPSGFWTDTICNEYGTAMALIILQIPNNYLPIFQRDAIDHDFASDRTVRRDR